MDEQDVERAVFFPTLGVGIDGLNPDNVAMTHKLFHAFNLWLDEDWGFDHRVRIYAAPYIPVLDPQLAAEELDFVLSRGARIFVMRPGPANGRSPADPSWDSFWARVNESGIVAAYHGFAGPDQYQQAFASMWQRHGVGDDDYERNLAGAINGHRAMLDSALALVLGNLFGRVEGVSRALGIGVATFVDRTAGIPDKEYGAIELRSDAGLQVKTGSSPYGQGHHTAWAMIVSDRTGVPMGRIEVVHGDTDLVPRGGLTGGSRSAQKAGSALVEAADSLVLAARQEAADMLEAAVDDVVFTASDGGRFHVAGSPAVWVGWADIAAERPANPLACEVDFAGAGPTCPFGAYVAVVEVDLETGGVGLQRMVTVDDAAILNPLLALGQVHGGVAQGIGQALYEEMIYDDAGNPLTATFADYAVTSAAELPSFESSLPRAPCPERASASSRRAPRWRARGPIPAVSRSHAWT